VDHSTDLSDTGDEQPLSNTSTPRRALNPVVGDTLIEATAAPSRALPVTAANTPSPLRLGVVALAAGAVATAGVGVTVAASHAVAQTPGGTAAGTQDLAAARNARLSTGALAAFTSRDTERDASSTAEAAAEARETALTATAKTVKNASVTALSTSRQQALSATAKSITTEEQKRKSEGWEPGSNNPSFLRPVAGGSFSSPFGWRTNPVTGASELHSGQDISIGCGTPIRAPQDGTVTFVGWYGSGGNALRIEHGKYNGEDIMSGYYHAERYVVSVGEKVTRGEVVGYVGTTGTSTGCHLHYMIFVNGTNVNPVPWIPAG
jgi:murein DD-endopeptidase MepM/ murein hydrolase activator NlpD